MKKGSLRPIVPALLLLLFVQSCSTPKATARDTDVVPLAVAEEMIDNYEGFLRNHKKSDGLLITATELTNILKDYEGQTVGIVFARYLKGDPADSGKKRGTLLLKTFPNGKDMAPLYRDLGRSRICPEPPDCVPRN